MGERWLDPEIISPGEKVVWKCKGLTINNIDRMGEQCMLLRSWEKSYYTRYHGIVLFVYAYAEMD